MTLAGRLPTTRWSLVIQSSATCPNDPIARQSLEELCQLYWPALYGYLRNRGYQRQDAEDLIQGFFGHLLERNAIGQADATRGRFRAFLYASLDHYVANVHRNENAVKRGGREKTFSLNHPAIESGADWDETVVDDSAVDPAAMFDRQWALWLIRQTLADLEAEYESSGKREWFQTLRPCIANGDLESCDRRAMANSLGLSATAFKVAVHRLRVRYRQRLLETIAQTVENIQDCDSERQWLFNALGVR